MTLMGLFVTADIVCSTMVMGLTIAGIISVILIASGRAEERSRLHLHHSYCLDMD